MNVASVILAAGYGTRMKSSLPKVMHSLLGRPMIEWALLAANSVSLSGPIVVVGHGSEQVMSHLGDRASYARQEELLGTGHAVMQAGPHAGNGVDNDVDAVLVTYGDMPLLQAETLQSLIDLFTEAQQEGNLAVAMLTVTRDDPQGFGRIARDETGEIVAIVEESDCTPEQLAIRELNPGVYCFDATWLWDNLPKITVSSKGEYYLTDMIGLGVQQGKRIVSLDAPPDELNGVNTRIHLAEATAVLRRRILDRHMLNGVTIVDPSSTLIEDSVSIGQDTVILPGTILQGTTTIGKEASIGPNSQIVDSAIGDECRVVYSVIEQAIMDRKSDIGPFGHLRKGAHLGEGVHMGNFGEVKNSYLSPGVKMGHFSYLGDTTVEADVNIGAGTVTCNHDGHKKHRTHIGAGAFIGSGTMLVAPLSIGEGAQTGAGSVVTCDVEANQLVYGVPAKPPKDHR
jgi:bifunctional UDP-N-acetylglucosamine pyrophosphorylase/glucosamine-1-phosphate N-acetyltransferase